MIGKRISIDYPGDTAKYDGRVIDYLPKKKIHKVYYFVDESIEELSLSSKRKWKIIEEPVPDPDPQGASALLGKLVKLPVNASEQLNPHEPIEDFRAVVLEIVKGGSR